MKIILLSLFLQIIIFSSIPAWAGIQDDITRYSDVTIEENGLARLKEYEHFITYFSKIPFFRKHQVVSSDFIMALIYAESLCKPEARSNKDALGLGQITFTTGSRAAKELAETGVDFKFVDETTLNDLQPKDLYNPAVNILLTCYLISKYNLFYDGRLDLVITAWNAGENTKSLKQGNPANFRETEDLIGKVNGYYLFLLKNKR